LARPSRKAGFTLAELLVAMTLVVLTMSAVYTAMGSSLRIWKMGEANLVQFQDARLSLGIMQKDLHGMVPNSWHLFEGDRDGFTFFTVARPMHTDTGTEPRVLQVTYSSKRNPRGPNRILEREEREVQEPLPMPKPKAPGPEGEEFAFEIDDSRVKTGRAHSFELALDVTAFTVRYLYTPMPPPVPQGQEAVPPAPVNVIVREEPHEDWGMPQGMEFTLGVADPDGPDGSTTFKTYVLFRNAPLTVRSDDLEVTG
jgi:prepilin-type N-terminal cleavage/methylation domain-containing protein